MKDTAADDDGSTDGTDNCDVDDDDEAVGDDQCDNEDDDDDDECASGEGACKRKRVGSDDDDWHEASRR